MFAGTREQTQKAWKILVAHREISYPKFDTTQIYLVQSSQSSTSTPLFLSTDNSGESQSTLAFANFDTPDASPVVVESNAETITYKDFVSDRQIEVINGANGIVATTTSISNPKELVSQRSIGAIGAGAAHCLQDAYSGHGLISIWAFIQTAIIPATGVAIAAGCVFHNVFPY